MLGVTGARAQLLYKDNVRDILDCAAKTTWETKFNCADATKDRAKLG